MSMTQHKLMTSAKLCMTNWFPTTGTIRSVWLGGLGHWKRTFATECSCRCRKVEHWRRLRGRQTERV